MLPIHCAKKPYEKLADGTIQEVEVPYEIPESWEWVRLGCVASLSFFPNISGDKIPNCSWVLDMEDIEKETGRLLRKNYKTEKSSYKSNKVSFSQNAVLYAKLRPNLKKVIVADEDGFATTELIPIKLFGNTSPEYIKHCMVSPFYYFNIIQSVYGVKMPRVNSTFLSTTLIPLPPLAEQKRIVAQIEKALVKVDEYAESYNKLQQLDKEFPDKLKKSILQYAMQGKLVAQDPNDEPVEVLLEKIKSEKQKLYEEGKLKKKDLAEIVVTEGDDSSPYGKKTKFDIDFQRKSSWLLLPLEKIVRSIPTKNHQIKQSAIRETGRFPVVSQSQALVEGFSNDKTKILENTDSLIIFGDHTRTLKLIDFPFIIGADGVKVLQPIGISPQFLKYHLECTILFVKDRGYARHYSYLKNKIIGIPSELEQNKITKKVDLLFEKVALLKR
ncbi:Type I restriction-modification system, specificity subunit S [Streptococcus agalactiae]|nr:restriction endonuclease subunit S [Streptococcus agalactiae]VFA67927.1 Type I restriction-modification system, specificity subunit S [Streptococcus agalactiae]